MTSLRIRFPRAILPRGIRVSPAWHLDGDLAHRASGQTPLTDAGERGNGFSDVIDVSRPTRGGRTFLQGLVSLAGAAGIALAVPFVILLIGLPIALTVRGLLEVVGWVLGVAIR